MSPVDFKKWQCPLSLFFKCPYPMLEKVQCRLLILGNHNVPCRYFLNVLVDFKVVQFRKGLGRASNLTVEGALVNHLSLNTSWYGEVAG